MDSPIRIIETGDGSHSLLNVALDETYHSRHGALRESEHVFIRHGLHAWIEQHPTATQLRILEVGLGTGLNALLTVREAINHPALSFHYTALEPHPLPEETLAQLNYLSRLDEASLHASFNTIHQATWEEDEPITDNFVLHKTQRTLEEFTAAPVYDLVYFDAFAPNKQAELWTLPVLQKVAGMMADTAIFVTYSAKGQLKRDLRTAGLTIETLDGPPGKAEMVRATLARATQV